MTFLKFRLDLEKMRDASHSNGKSLRIILFDFTWISNQCPAVFSVRFSFSLALVIALQRWRNPDASDDLIMMAPLRASMAAGRCARRMRAEAIAPEGLDRVHYITSR